MTGWYPRTCIPPFIVQLTTCIVITFCAELIIWCWALNQSLESLWLTYYCNRLPTMIDATFNLTVTISTCNDNHQIKQHLDVATSVQSIYFDTAHSKPVRQHQICMQWECRSLVILRSLHMSMTTSKSIKQISCSLDFFQITFVCCAPSSWCSSKTTSFPLWSTALEAHSTFFRLFYWITIELLIELNCTWTLSSIRGCLSINRSMSNINKSTWTTCGLLIVWERCLQLGIKLWISMDWVNTMIRDESERMKQQKNMLYVMSSSYGIN